jgi:molybdopterin-binding protein
VGALERSGETRIKGLTVTASITNEAVDELGLKAGLK